jgi:hypothetical protein
MIKICHRCGRERTIRHFHRDRTKRDGLCAACKQCRRVAKQGRDRCNAEAKRAYQRAYYASHRDAILAKQREARRADPETTRAIARLYAPARRKTAAYRAYQREWQRERRAMLRDAA